jgi:uncharacterized protein (TIGR02466 family)
MAPHSHISTNYNNSYQEPNYERYDVEDVIEDVLFPSFLYQYKLKIDNNKILEDCYSAKKIFPESVSKSNMGGWQSETYSLRTIQEKYIPNIQNLCYNVIDICNDISERQDLRCNFFEHGLDWWININKKYCYNAIHSHPGASLVGLYYAKIKRNGEDGNLVLMRNDGSNHTQLYGSNDIFSTFELEAEVGSLYIFPSHIIHYVRPNLSDEERISISFNISIS